MLNDCAHRVKDSDVELARTKAKRFLGFYKVSLFSTVFYVL